QRELHDARIARLRSRPTNITGDLPEGTRAESRAGSSRVQPVRNVKHLPSKLYRLMLADAENSGESHVNLHHSRIQDVQRPQVAEDSRPQSRCRERRPV